MESEQVLTEAVLVSPTTLVTAADRLALPDLGPTERDCAGAAGWRERAYAVPSWDEVRAAFDLGGRFFALGAAQFLASHPARVRAAIAHWREELDRNRLSRVNTRSSWRPRSCSI
jgi:hypothetical protein